jgi:uncharacterized OsmC-like protein
MPDETRFALGLDRITGYAFETRFDWQKAGPLRLDEPEPLGGGTGPNAARLVGAAIGHCLSASLLFCLEKAKQPVTAIKADVAGAVRRNEKGRWRIARLDVRIAVDVSGGQLERVRRCLELFEDYCVVTASVRKGVQVNVVVTDPHGTEMFRRDSAPVDLA